MGPKQSGRANGGGSFSDCKNSAFTIILEKKESFLNPAGSLEMTL